MSASSAESMNGIQLRASNRRCSEIAIVRIGSRHCVEVSLLRVYTQKYPQGGGNVARAESRRYGTFQVTAYRCRCGHEWVPKKLRNAERPRVCPKCKSANWDKPYQFRRGDYS